uniref:Glutathione S-transferase T3-like n=1 Tax=Tanacetum cinerariifolium TaxID=118510 RepID=A0A6L2MDS9_TANCI|nr:glutathione S-transferase T3-like [Tanacetum cinerariifolium]
MCKHPKWKLNLDHDKTRLQEPNEENGGSTKRSRVSEEGDYVVHSNQETPNSSGSTIRRPTGRDAAKKKRKGRTAKLRNDILMFQQHHGESLSESGTRFKDLIQKVSHHGINLWLQAKESWALLEDLALYDNESWNDIKDFANPVKEISLPQDVSSTSDRRLIEFENKFQRLMEAHFAPMQPTQVNKITSSYEICSGPYDTQHCMENLKQAFIEYASSRTDEAGESLELGKNESTFLQGEVSAKMEDLGLFTLPCRLGDLKPFETLADLGSCVNIILLYLFKKLNIRLLEETDHIFRLADGTKSYPKDPETPLLVGRGFLATANAVIDCKKAKIAVREGITMSVFRVKGVNLGEEEAPYWTTLGKRESYKPRPRSDGIDVLVFRRMVEFLGALPINLKRNMWESKDLIENLINWDKPPKDGDRSWHAKIRIIDPGGEEFTKTLQLIPTARKLPERESPKEIINLDHFYDT